MALSLDLSGGLRRYLALGGGVLLVLGATWFFGDCGGSADDNGGVELELDGEGDAPVDVWVPEGHEWVGDWISLVSEVQHDLGAATGADLSNLRFLVSSADRVGDVLAANVAARDSSGQTQLAQAQTNAYRDALLGIYELEKGVVHIPLENFRTVADRIGFDDVISREVVYAVMLHEGAHAVADQRHGLAAFFQDAHAAGDEAVTAADAVSEGFAQRVARRVATATGRLAGFETFTTAITKLPEGLDAGERLMAEQQVQAFAFAYVRGEAFVDAVVASEGGTGEDLVFQDPPRSRAEILRPDWYLDPDARPEYEYELDAALALAPDAFDHVANMSFLRRELTGADIAAGNRSALGDTRADAMGALFEVCEVNIGLTPDGDSLAMIGLTIFPDEASADRFLALAQEASSIRDQELQGPGSVQVIESTTDLVPEELGIGIDQRKRLQADDRQIPTRSLMVRRGPLLLEITISNVVLQEGAAEQLANAMLRKAMLLD